MVKINQYLLCTVSVALFCQQIAASPLPKVPILSRGCTSFAVRTISPAEEGLFVHCGNTDFRIYHPKNLQGLTEISNSEEALRFVRFFTSRQTFFLVGLGGDVEVLPAGQSADLCCYSAQKPHAGLAAAEIQRLENPVEGKVFVIRRNVVGLDQAIYQVRERVTEFGNYDQTRRDLILRDASKLGIVHIGEH